MADRRHPASRSFRRSLRPSGHGKSFAALDWALCVATGSTWFGRATSEGAVVYIVAEGGRGIRKRVRAWLEHRGWPKLPDAFFLLDSVQITDERICGRWLQRIAALGVPVKLIVVDTLARCFVGRDENSAQDMGEFVAGIDRLKQETGAAVVVVHHSGKSKDGKPSDIERGSSALRAAADVMVSVTMDKDKVIALKNTKQKDYEEFAADEVAVATVLSVPGRDRLDIMRVGGRRTDYGANCVVTIASSSVSSGPCVISRRRGDHR